MTVRPNHRGFTLIELIIVIVILGILAVTAAPKFIDFSGDAQIAALKSISGSMSSATKMIRAKAIASGKEGPLSVTDDFGLGRGSIDLHYGYPRTVWNETWSKLLDLNAKHITDKNKATVCTGDKDYCVLDHVKNGVTAHDWSLYIFPNGKSVNSNCYSRYTLDVGTTATGFQHQSVATVTSGC